MSSKQTKHTLGPWITDLEQNKPDDLHREDADYIRQAAEAEGADLPEARQ